MFNVVNNFIDNEHLFSIQKIINSVNFPWFIVNQNPFILSHKIIDKVDNKISINSDFFTPLTEDIIKKLKVEKINFCQLSLFTKDKSPKEIPDRLDLENFSLNNKAVFFINSSNGYVETLESKLEAVENRVLIFNRRTPFKIHTQTDTNYMAILEIDYL